MMFAAKRECGLLLAFLCLSAAPAFAATELTTTASLAEKVQAESAPSAEPPPPPPAPEPQAAATPEPLPQSVPPEPVEPLVSTPKQEAPPLSEPAAALPDVTVSLPETPKAKEKPRPDTGRDEFRAALAHVYKRHPQLMAQREALRATDEGVAQAISGFRPNVAAGYSYGRQRNETSGNTDWNYNTARNRELTVEQPVFSGGETLAGYASAKSRVKAGRAQLKALEQQLLLDAVVAYTGVVEKQFVLEENQNNVDVLTKQFEATKARYDVGELTKTDLAQSQARLASAQAGERQALGDLESSRATFRRVIGYEAPPSIDLPPLPEALPERLADAIAWAEATDPTLEAARHLEEASASDVDVRAAAVLPDVGITGSMDRRHGGNSFGPTRVNSDTLMMNLSIPLYQSGAEWSRIREAKNQAQQAKFTTMDAHDALVEGATRAWQAYTTARAVINSNEEAVHAAEEALESIRQEALYGTRTILDVLNTEQDLFVARVGLVQAKVAEKQQAYRLLAAVGRLTARDMHLSVDLEDVTQHYDQVKYKLIGF